MLITKCLFSSDMVTAVVELLQLQLITASVELASPLMQNLEVDTKIETSS